MKAYLTRRYMFPASHRLHSDALTDAENATTFGKCNNPHGHGHNYFVEVTVSGQVDAKTGMVCDLVAIDDCVRQEILGRFDHQNLNTLDDFKGVVPTTENLCVAIYDIMQRSFRDAHVEKIRLEETASNSFEYAGGADPCR